MLLDDLAHRSLSKICLYIKPVRFISEGARLGWVEPLCENFQFTDLSGRKVIIKKNKLFIFED